MAPAQTGGRPAVDVDPGARVVTRARTVPDVGLEAILATGDGPRVHWAGRDGLELSGVGAAARLVAAGAGRFEAIETAAVELFDDVDHEGPPATRPRLFGGFAFDTAAGRDAGRANDPDEPQPALWRGFPDALFVLPRLQLVRGGDRTWLAATAVGDAVTAEAVEARLDEAVDELSSPPVSRGSARPGVRDTSIQPDRATWIADVERAVDRIASGDLGKLVLATAMDVALDEPVDLPAVLRRLRGTYPDCYRFLVQPADCAAFFGPPPERLVRLEDGEVRTEALAGSIARGETPTEDEQLAQSLRTDEKRRHEQRLVVDAIREQLGTYGAVAKHDRTVRELETIQHLRTPLTATVDEPVHVLSLVEALHPTPAVGGLPRGAALDAIRETEQFDRGWYAAPVGWIDPAGDGEFAVAIRSGVTDGTRARLFAGNGIVADSDPAEEWSEIEPKLRPILDELE